MDEAAVWARLAEARVGRLATVDPAGRPHVVPVGFVLDGRVLYWAVDHKPKASRHLRRLDNLAANPSAELVVDHYQEDWTGLWWVRVRMDARVLPEGEEAERALDALVTKYPQYRGRRPEGPVVRMDVRSWTAWSAAEGSVSG